MKQPAYRLLALVALVVSAAAVGCSSNQQPLVVTPNTPSSRPGPTASPSPGASAEAGATTAASPSPSATPEPVGFRDDFTGPVLDPAKWSSFPQSGIIRFQDGKLDLLNTAAQKNFPYLVTKEAVVPQAGPFFVEFAYQYASLGSQISFSLDFFPAEAPGIKPLTTPFMSTVTFYASLKLNFVTEAGTPSFTAPNGAAANTQHRVRIENDNQDHYRVIFDSTELGTFTSKRRPQKFWIGQNPPADVPATSWPRIGLDYVEISPLASPDPATPAPSATPS